MMNINIPQNRLLAYLMIAGLLPVFLVAFLVYNKIENFTEQENNLIMIQEMAFNREKKQAVNIAVINHFRDADHFYIDKYLETLTFLDPEVESLKKVVSNPNFPEDENIKKRLDALTGSANSLIFTEGVVQSTPVMQEVVETLVHPVEVNVSDLQEILTRIEGIPIGPYTPSPNRPQLIITDFKMDKKIVSEKNEVFLINMKLLKREFL